MGVLVHCSSVCYAVIQVSSKKDRPERLVIAYHDENCLRDLIASSSVCGFDIMVSHSLNRLSSKFTARQTPVPIYQFRSLGWLRIQYQAGPHHPNQGEQQLQDQTQGSESNDARLPC